MNPRCDPNRLLAAEPTSRCPSSELTRLQEGRPLKTRDRGDAKRAIRFQVGNDVREDQPFAPVIVFGSLTCEGEAEARFPHSGSQHPEGLSWFGKLSTMGRGAGKSSNAQNMGSARTTSTP